MPSKAGRVQQLNMTKLKSVSNMNRPLSLTRHAWSQTRINCDQIFAGVISNEMPCIQHHEHCLTYCVVSASQNWRSLTENFATVGAVWVSVEPNIRLHYVVLLWSSQSDVHKFLHLTQHESVVLPVKHHEKLFHCAIIWSINNITIENVLSFYTLEHLRWLLCNWLWDICTI